MSSPVPCDSCDKLRTDNDDYLREICQLKGELDKMVNENKELKNALDKQKLELKEANLYLTHYRTQMYVL